MVSERPLLSVVTMTRWGPAFPRIARWLAAGFREIGAQADVVYVDRRPPLFDPDLGLQGPTGDPAGPTRELELGATRARAALPRLVGYLRDRRPLVTVATPGTIGGLAIAAGMATGCRVVPWEQTVPLMDQADVPRAVRPVKAVTNVLYRRAPRIIAVSEGVREALVEELGPRIPADRFVVVPNPLDVAEIGRLARPAAQGDGRFRMCTIGRLVSAKGFDVLIDALAEARLSTPWELVLIGDGPLRQDLERQVAARGLGDNVRFAGNVDNPYPLLASADLAVQASRWEGFGIAVLEALALGVPIIATTCPGGVADILDGGRYGVLVPPGDVAGLAEALRTVSADGGLRERLAADGVRRAASYGPGEVAGRMVAIAREIAGVAPSSGRPPGTAGPVRNVRTKRPTASTGAGRR